MKRIAYAITGLLALTLLVTGMAPVQASTTPSTTCSDGSYTEVQVLDDPAVPLYVAVEAVAVGPDTLATVCYKDRSGVTDAGGHVMVLHKAAYDELVVSCAGDLPALVVLNCYSHANVHPSDPDPGSVGTAVSGWAKVEDITLVVPLSGAEVGSPDIGTTQGTSASNGNTCAWVVGIQILPSCRGRLVGAYVNFDTPPVVTTTTVPVCAGVHVGGNCIGTVVSVPLVDNAYFTTGGQPGLAGVTVLGQTFSDGGSAEGCWGLRSDDNPECGED